MFVLFFLLGVPVEVAGEEEKDKARDQDPGEPARGHQHHSAGGHGERPSGRISVLTSQALFIKHLLSMPNFPFWSGCCSLGLRLSSLSASTTQISR